MKREIIYTDAPPEIEDAIEHGIIIENFLPPPELLVLKKSDQQAASKNTTLFRKQKRHELALA